MAAGVICLNVFTEHGAAMLANVLNSSVAVQASIHVVRAFVRIRELAITHKELSKRLDELEMRFDQHDQKFHIVFDAIRQLMTPPVSPKKRIGFHVEDK